MKTIEQKRQELQSEKDNISKESEVLKLRLEDINSKLELLNNVELLLSDEEEVKNPNSLPPIETNKSNGNLFFKRKGEITVREAVIKVLKKADQSVHLDELIPAVEELGIDSSRQTIRARVAKMVDKEVERVSDGVYKLIEQ